MKEIEKIDVDVLRGWIETYWNANTKTDKTLQLIALENIFNNLKDKYTEINIEDLFTFIESVYKLTGYCSEWFLNNLLIQLGIEVIDDKKGEE